MKWNNLFFVSIVETRTCLYDLWLHYSYWTKVNFFWGEDSNQCVFYISKNTWTYSDLPLENRIWSFENPFLFLNAFRALDSNLSNVSRLLWQKYRNLISFLGSAHCHRFREKKKEGLEERCLICYFREGTHRPMNKLLYVVRRMPQAKEGAHAGW